MLQVIYHGNNLVPEGLEIGEPKVQGTAEFDELEPAFMIAYTGSTFAGQNIGQTGYSYNGIPSSVTYILCNIIGAFQFAINAINEIDQTGSMILSCFTVPRLAVLTKLQEIEGNQTPRTNCLCC